MNGDNKIVSSTGSDNEAAIGTIIGYAKGKWGDSDTHMGVTPGVSGMSGTTIAALKDKHRRCQDYQKYSWRINCNMDKFWKPCN